MELYQKATMALLLEASLSPKPGLVDSLDSGAHHDMDLSTFIASSLALEPYFKLYYELGLNHQGSLTALFSKCRDVGQQAESAMFKATHGINTHKGANFTFALFLSALGFYQGHASVTQLCASIKEMCINLHHDFDQLEKKITLSHGEALYMQTKHQGLRQQAQAGYPLLSQSWLPFYDNLPKTNPQQAYLRLLLKIMSECDDTTILHRGGTAGLDWMHERSAQALIQPFSYELMRELNHEFIARKLSPGGCADMLALCIFLTNL